MYPLMLILAGIGVAAAAATWYALLSAQEGYEDETGFHLISWEKQRRSQPAASVAAPVGAKASSEVRPGASVR